MFLAEDCARGVSWPMVGTWASPGMGTAPGWGACLVAMSAEELDQTLSCVISTRRDVSGSKLNHVVRAVRCRGPSYGYAKAYASLESPVQPLSCTCT